MIISHKYKFIFVHVSKCGGTSITKALLPYLGDNDLVLGVARPNTQTRIERKITTSLTNLRSIYPYLEKKYFVQNNEPNLNFKAFVKRMEGSRKRNGYRVDKHSTASELREFMGANVWDDYYKFSFVRNPWDRIVSTYFWLHKSNWKDARGNADRVRSLPDFASFVKSNFLYFAKSSTSMIYDSEERKLVDFVGKFENFEQDFSKICQAVGLPKIDLPKENTSQRSKNYRDYYVKETIDIIRDKYSQDVSNFCYQF